MKKIVTTLLAFWVLTQFCGAQESGVQRIQNGSDSKSVDRQNSNVEAAKYYASLTREIVGLKVQSGLLNDLAQEHRKRAQEAGNDPSSKAQWENELAKEFAERSTSLVGVMNTAQKELAALERAHPEFAILADSSTGAPARRSPNEAVFMGKLEDRLAMVQQEIADTLEIGKVYTAQLATNTASSDFSRITFLIQENGRLAKQLQKEASDLELRKLEFQALRKE